LIFIQKNINYEEEEMEKTMFVKPRKGLIVRDPKTLSPLAENGEIKPFVGKEGTYWRRQLRDGSIGVVNSKSVSKTTNTEKPKEKNDDVKIMSIVNSNKKGGK